MKHSKNEKSSSATDTSCLNIMYFINHGRVRTLKLSTWKWKAIASALALLIMWLGISSIWLYRTTHSLILTKERLAESQQTVFDYQERHDRVYERVYPDLHAPDSSSYSSGDGTVTRPQKPTDAHSTPKKNNEPSSANKPHKPTKKDSPTSAPKKNTPER